MRLRLVLWGHGFLASSTFAFQPPRAARPTRSVYRTNTQLAQSSVSSSCVSIDESTPRDVSAFDEWASMCGVQRADGFQLTSEDGMDVHAMTTDDLAAGSPVLYVPAEMILSSYRCKEEFAEYARGAANLLQTLGGGDHLSEFYLFLKVLMEYEKGESSPWYPYLNSLPRVYYNGASMTPFCYECLPPLAASLAMDERTRLIYFNQALKQVNFLSEDTKADKDLAKWAFQVATTRSFEGMNGDLCIAPMADMFNHGTQTEVELNYDESGNCIVYASTDVPAGSPLRMSYGDPTNPSFLFARYGFLDETSPATFCKIMMTPTTQLRDMGYDYSRMLFYKDTGEVSREVYDVLLYQILASNKQEQQAFYEAHMRGDSDTKRQFHERYYPETNAALRKHVDTFLKDLDNLSAKAVGKSVNEHPRLPLIMRHNEFVKETFLAVRANL